MSVGQVKGQGQLQEAGRRTPEKHWEAVDQFGAAVGEMRGRAKREWLRRWRLLASRQHLQVTGTQSVEGNGLSLEQKGKPSSEKNMNINEAVADKL